MLFSFCNFIYSSEALGKSSSEGAKKVAENLHFDSEFAVRRKKRSKRFHDEPGNTAHYHDGPEKEFEVNVFNVGIDHLIQQISTRFDASKNVSNMFWFLWLPKDGPELRTRNKSSSSR